ncbi:MAG: hypothetical protein EKK46_17970 [Rhodocyclaceae bacterium]|nr:MAG: hypothetical protein EKK46_17970 [Rhodocyclaceae bacterium]
MDKHLFPEAVLVALFSSVSSAETALTTYLGAWLGDTLGGILGWLGGGALAMTVLFPALNALIDRGSHHHSTDRSEQ